MKQWARGQHATKRRRRTDGEFRPGPPVRGVYIIRKIRLASFRMLFQQSFLLSSRCFRPAQ